MTAPAPKTIRLRQAREVARRLKLYSPRYCSATKDFDQPELRLWWEVLETAISDTAYLGTGSTRGANADSAVEWLTGGGCHGVLEVLGLDPGFVRRIMKRWLKCGFEGEK